jgi:hypothetical protein
VAVRFTREDGLDPLERDIGVLRTSLVDDATPDTAPDTTDGTTYEEDAAVPASPNVQLAASPSAASARIPAQNADFKSSYSPCGQSSMAASMNLIREIERVSEGVSGVMDHGLLTGLEDDDHLQYLLLAGRSGGQIAYGGIASGEILTLRSTSFSTKGYVHVGPTEELRVNYFARINSSDSSLDPVIKWSVNLDPLTLFTSGVDRSDSDKWKISNLSTLGTLAESQGSFGEILVFFHASDEDIDYIDLDDFSTDGVVVNGTTGSGDGELCPSPKSIAFDGVYIYVADDTNNRVVKFDLASGAYIANVSAIRPWGLCLWGGVLYCIQSSSPTGPFNLYIINPDAMSITATYPYDYGSGDDDLKVPRGMSTDGTNLFICDSANSRIKKTSLSGAYVSQVGSSGSGNGEFGASSPTDCEIDGDYLYVCDYGNKRIQIFDKATLTYVGQHPTQTVGGTAGSPASIAINDTYYYIGCHHAVPENGYIEKYDIATRTYQGSHDTIVSPTLSRADALWAAEIAKFSTSLEKHGDLFVIHQDGSYIDHWPICRFVDDIRLVQDGDDEDGDYVGLRAPAAVGTSYTLTFPADLPAGQSHVSCSSSGTLSFGQDVNTTASPSFVALTLTQATGTAPMTISSTTVVTNLNADMVDGLHSTSFNQRYISATASPTANDDINQTPTAFLEGCIWVEQDSNTVWFCGDNANGAAVWHGIDQDLLTTSTPLFSGATLSGNLIVYRDGASEIGIYASHLSEFPQLSIYRSRGTYASKTSVGDEDYVGRIQFFAYSDNPALPYLVGVIESQVKSISGVTPYGALNISAKSGAAVGIYLSDLENIGLFTSTFGTGAVKVLALATGTAPSTAPADAFQMYSKDVSAGNAAPHFMLEGGEEVSLRNDGYYVDGVAVGGGGASAFTDLTDVDSDYTGDGGKFVKVNAGETGLEFVASSAAGHDLASATHEDVDDTGLSDDDILRYDSASGEWKCEALPAASNHDILSATHGDTTASAVSRGSIIYGDSTPKWAELAVGAAGHVLTSDGTDIAWAAPSGGGAVSFTDLDDVPANYTDDSLKLVRVNSGETALEFITQATLKLDDFGAPDDNTDLNVSTSAHGLCPKAPNIKDQYFRGDGAWAQFADIFGHKIVGRYYCGGFGSTTVTNAALSADYLRAVPFYLTKRQAFDRISLHVVSAAGAGRYFRIGIYANKTDGTLYPGALVLDSGAVEAAAIGFYETVISQTLDPGIYWLAYLSSYALNVRLVSVAGTPGCYSLGAADGTTGQDAYIQVSQAYGALPDPFTAGAVPGTAGDYYPNVVLRAA